jgi:RNA polymerase primary sigma factor
MAASRTRPLESSQRISELLSGLSEREAKLLTLRFGLEGGLPMSPEDTGKRLGLTPEEVVAMEAAALQKLRN